MIAVSQYFVTVTDANGCTFVDSVTLGQPTVLLASASSVNASCGLSDGSVSVTGTGGTLPYTFLWNTTDVTDTVYGLGAGIYTVTVYDVNGCNATSSATITTDAAATITVNSITNILCYGDSEGAVDLSLNGGTPDFTVVVASTDTSFYTTNAIVIDSLGAGTFLIEISDANGCSSDTTITINQPASPVLVNTSISSISCHGLTDGIIIANVSGGTSPYNYNWSNGTTGIGINTITGLPAQTYTLTVTDANGCTVIRVELGVTQPDSIEITFAAVSPVCGGIDNGSLTALVQGGVQPYDYAWTTGGGDSLITGLGGGQYIVTVTDAHMCNVTVSYTLFEPTVIVVDTTTGSDPSTNLGFIHLEVTGGGMPYLYAWSNGATSQDLDGLASGTYTLTLTDDNGCVLTLSFVIEIPLKIPDAITPNGDGINDQFEILNIGAYMDISIQIFNRWGDQVFLFEGTGTEYTDMENQWDGQYNGSDLPMGGYVYIIKLGEKEPLTGVVTIIR
jgi:gliding motility-associated-like protein